MENPQRPPALPAMSVSQSAIQPAAIIAISHNYDHDHFVRRCWKKIRLKPRTKCKHLASAQGSWSLGLKSGNQHLICLWLTRCLFFIWGANPFFPPGSIFSDSVKKECSPNLMQRTVRVIYSCVKPPSSEQDGWMAVYPELAYFFRLPCSLSVQILRGWLRLSPSSTAFFPFRPPLHHPT